MDAAAALPLTIRPATTHDTDFLVPLPAAVRGPELDGADPVSSASRLRREYVADEARHRDRHPAATHHVIELAREPIGQCRLGPNPDRVAGGDAGTDHLGLVDLTLHPDHEQLVDAVIDTLHRHAEWFGVRLHTVDPAGDAGSEPLR